MQSTIQIVRERSAVSSLLQPLRARMLEFLAEPESAAGLARKLEMPRQQVNYHLREMEKAGLVEQVAERRKGGLMERLVQATARTYVISPEVLGDASKAAAVKDRFSLSYLIATAGRIIRDLAAIKERATSASKRFATLTIEAEVRFLNADSRHTFAEELATAVANLAAKYNKPEGEGRLFRLVIGCYPAITKTNGSDECNETASKQLSLPLK